MANGLYRLVWDGRDEGEIWYPRAFTSPALRWMTTRGMPTRLPA